MVKWVYFVISLVTSGIILCEATSPTLISPTLDDVDGEDDQGVCDDTPTQPTCGENEELSDCVNRGCRRWEGGVICNDLQEGSCQKGCVCKESYTRDEDGKCIPEEKCPGECGLNEEYSSCANGGCRRFTCAINFILCVDLIEGACEAGCICKNSYTRADNGTCIPEDECPPTCGENEVYDVCPSLCTQKKCDVDEQLVDCSQKLLPGDPNCQPGCRCADNYYRNKDGLCVTKEECPPLDECGTNEIASSCINGGCWKESCAFPQTICGKPAPGGCKKGCRCKENYLRSDNGTCIPESECPQNCGLNEIYDECPPTCPPQRCDIDNRLIKCKRTPTPGDPDCKPGCRCKDDFYRNDLGTCVTRDECPPLIKCGENEYASKCANGGCQKISCANPLTRCVKLAPGSCQEGCLCKENYLRADNGTCIPEKDCPKSCGPNEEYKCDTNCNKQCVVIEGKCVPPNKSKSCKLECRCKDGYSRDEDGNCVSDQPSCRKNEEPSECANGGCRKWQCSDKGVICKDLQEGSCQKGCVCKESYVRDANGKCIPEDQCPQKPEKCGLNEEYSFCANGGCRRYTCAMKGILCVDLIEGGCRAGCICKKSYTRADNGTCIPENQCPPTCGDNEVYDVCPSLCPPKRCDVDESLIDCAPNPSPGDPNCQPGCRCADNYYRNENGLCVTKEECPPLIHCGPNEIALRCANGGCWKRSCARPQTVCVELRPGACKEGCRCKENYLRSDNGTCIPESECPHVCGLNEIYDECPRTCPPQRCNVDNRLIKCKKPPKKGDPDCKPGCRCKDDFYRNDLGTCVTRDECPPLIKCGENEYASKCANGGCRKISCANPVTRCVKLAPGACKEGCLCKENYLRADNGTCIPEELCPPSCGVNEVYDYCPPICPAQRCDVDIATILCKPNPLPGDPECQPSCRCVDNYVKNKENICVPRDECPPPNTCGPNEEYSDCANGGCRRFSCNTTGIDCVDLEEGACEPGCICKNNYTRADNGTCIPESECPPTCEVNEVYDICPPLCPPQRCDVDDRIIRCAANPKPGDPKCKPGCRCADNYYRNDKGVCVTRAECPKCFGANEVYACQSSDPQTCESIGPEFEPLKKSKQCKRECRCKEGFYRNKIGDCISKENCLKCTGPHEFFSCGSACVNECRTIKTQNQTNCPIINIVCNNQCYCEDGYAYDENRICIPISECPPQPSCGDNEEPSDCANGGCRRWACSDDGIICNDLQEGSCQKGCVCKESYTRDEDGKCIPEDQCPAKCFGANEVYACQSSDPQTCESIGQEFEPLKKSKHCKRECRCKEGFYRNKIGDCISKENCLKCTGPHEFFSCGSACVNECRTIKTQNQTNCPIVNIVCNKQCYCEDGYAYDENRLCIPISECPPPPKLCGPNEEYSDCANGGCRRFSCNTTGIDCVDLEEGACEPGCICKNNYTRADNDTCIPESECPPTCEVNEVYDICPPLCPPQRCDVDDRIIRCAANPKPGDPKCKPGCRCADNYYRNDKGVCVTRAECPKCFGANEVYACQSSDPQTCESIGQEFEPLKKSKHCKRECRCKEGFYRNKIGVCISKENCLKCTGPHEFFSCGSACVNECRTIKTQNQTNCPIVNKVCNRQCYCEDGYAYDENRICIPISECPPQPSCGDNKEPSDCANGGCRRWACSDDAPCGPNEEYGCDSNCNKQCDVIDGKCVPPNKTKSCKRKCRCTNGYTRNKSGVCLPTCEGITEKTVDGLTEFEEGNLHFTESFLLTAAKNNPNASVIGSPFSILFLLAQLALYATGNSKTELLGLLNLSNDCEIRSFVPQYLKQITVTNNASFDFAQKIYGSAKYPFSENFKKDTKEIFNAQAQNVDFSKPKEAADIINKWVAQQTRNLIPSLISPDALSSYTRLVLANAIYFKGDWRYQFKARNTKSLPFYTGKTKDDSVQVKMMNQIGNFKYTEINDVQILQLPYKAADISFVIYLPRSRTGIKELIKNLKKSSLIKRSFTELRSTRVDVSMPRLDIATTTDLKPLLFDAGVKAIFDPSTAGLSGILAKPEEIFVTSGIQKAKILLNETGTEAAAATAVVVGVRSLPISEPDPVEFKADHSFLYFITYKKLPIFVGIYQGPS